MKNAFLSGSSIVDDPATDRWGTWISAYAPLNDERTGELVAVLGIDQNADSYKHAMKLERFESIIYIGIICLAGLFMFVYWQRFVFVMDHDKETDKLSK